ncbi:MAG: PrgI family protein [Candidatus Pacebacteria bacterium]|nr:PrgI family protein [Candidatus Paceibacterota bacterium]MBP9843123.1 PrgI family protein [Candidatus Paceibacterota bacterium]
MRFEVPQFIEIEDKIFGPLTWRQFLYLGGGLGMAVVMFLMLPFIIFAIFGIPLALLAGALAFYPINSRPFSYFLESFINYTTKEKLYLWRKREEATYKVTQDNRPSSSHTAQLSRTRKTSDISSLARKLELQAIQKQQ